MHFSDQSLQMEKVLAAFIPPIPYSFKSSISMLIQVSRSAAVSLKVGKKQFFNINIFIHSNINYALIL